MFALSSNSAQQQEIIDHPSSCYVIGGSGTGKTTTMLFKMLGIQRTWQKNHVMAPKPRQVFVTQSRVLVTKVEEYFAKLMSSLEAGGYSPEELRMVEKDVDQESDLVNQDDKKQWRSDLPERFSELLDEHFPLFITYDRVRTFTSSNYLISPFREQLCTMLQNDIRSSNHNNFITPETSSSDYMQQSRGGFVSYGIFLSSYWDHLPQSLTRVLGKKQLLIYDSL